ncbi:MAG: GTP-binding protein [Candidatus Hodarchaeales archaeon]
MSDPPILKLLEDFGLSSAEAEVLSILLQSSRTSLTGNEVARETSITRYYVFSLLSRLVQKGYAAEIKERPRRYYSTLDMLRRTIEVMEKDQRSTVLAIEESRNDSKKFFEVMGFDEEIWLGYEILLEGPASRKTLIERANERGLELTYEHIRRITDVLVDRHYAEKFARGRTFNYQTTSLEEIIEREKGRIREEWDERKKALLRHLDTLSGSVGVSSAYSPIRINISIIRDAKAIPRKILAEGLRAEEVLSTQFLRLQLDDGNYSKALGTTFFNFVELIEAGVNVRLLVNDLSLFHIAAIPESVLSRLYTSPARFAIKIASQIMYPCVIIDESCVFEFPLLGGVPFNTSILLDGTEFTKQRRLEFEEIWDQSEDIRPYIRPLISPTLRGIVDKGMRSVEDLDFRIIVCGEMDVGKTCLVKRFCSGRYPLNITETIGVRIDKKSIEIPGRDESTKKVNLHIYDLSGNMKYQKLHQRYVEGANGIIFSFDLHDEKSFEAVRNWHEYLGKDAKIPSVLVSTKNDEKRESTLSEKQFDRLRQECGFDDYISTSAKTGVQVDTPFTAIAKLILGLFDRQGRLPRLTTNLPSEWQFGTETVRSQSLQVKVRD